MNDIEGRKVFGRRLREIRESRKLSQWEAAKKVGVTANTWLAWEKGYTRPDGYRIPKIALVLGVSEEFLMTGAEVAEKKASIGDAPQAGSFAAAVEQSRRILATAAMTSPERLRLIIEFL